MKMAQALHSQPPHRKALCTYYSSDTTQLVAEIQTAYRAAATAASRSTAAAAAAGGNTRSKLLALVVSLFLLTIRSVYDDYLMNNQVLQLVQLAQPPIHTTKLETCSAQA
jgi:2',3'-cyclic-nucleotide 2'-phosphodiesterase (5'-nucleotidase family)